MCLWDLIVWSHRAIDLFLFAVKSCKIVSPSKMTERARFLVCIQIVACHIRWRFDNSRNYSQPHTSANTTTRLQWITLIQCMYVTNNVDSSPVGLPYQALRYHVSDYAARTSFHVYCPHLSLRMRTLTNIELFIPTGHVAHENIRRQKFPGVWS